MPVRAKITIKSWIKTFGQRNQIRIKINEKKKESEGEKAEKTKFSPKREEKTKRKRKKNFLFSEDFKAFIIQKNKKEINKKESKKPNEEGEE